MATNTVAGPWWTADAYWMEGPTVNTLSLARFHLFDTGGKAAENITVNCRTKQNTPPFGETREAARTTYAPYPVTFDISYELLRMIRMLCVLVPAKDLVATAFLETLNNMLTALHASTRPGDAYTAFHLLYETLTPLCTPRDIVDPGNDPCAALLYKSLEALKTLRAIVKHARRRPEPYGQLYDWRTTMCVRRWRACYVHICRAFGATMEANWAAAFHRCIVIDGDINKRVSDTLLAVASATHPRLGCGGEPTAVSPLYRLTPDALRMVSEM
eukprot:3291617-Rhodomonas_salina.1